MSACSNAFASPLRCAIRRAGGVARTGSVCGAAAFVFGGAGLGFEGRSLPSDALDKAVLAGFPARPRMTHDQLARLFPDGRTVHIPTDGKPLKGYELARADIQRRDQRGDGALTKTRPSLFAGLFGVKPGDDENKALTQRRPAENLLRSA